MLKIYFDNCCLNRPFDDQTQVRVRLESEAVLLILSRIEQGEWSWIGSDVLCFQGYDAFHLACAESAKAEVFLSTDDRLLKLAKRLSKKLQVVVANPLVWLEELEK